MNENQFKMPVARRKKMGWLEIDGKSHNIYEGINMIGRDLNAAIKLRDVKYSKQHAQISVVNENEHFISDFSSSNGTYLKETKLSPFLFYKVNDGDEVKLSDSLGLYHKCESCEVNALEDTILTQCNYNSCTQKIADDTQTQILEVHSATTMKSNKPNISYAVCDDSIKENSPYTDVHGAETQILSNETETSPNQDSVNNHFNPFITAEVSSPMYHPDMKNVTLELTENENIANSFFDATIDETVLSDAKHNSNDDEDDMLKDFRDSQESETDVKVKCPRTLPEESEEDSDVDVEIINKRIRELTEITDMGNKPLSDNEDTDIEETDVIPATQEPFMEKRVVNSNENMNNSDDDMFCVNTQHLLPKKKSTVIQNAKNDEMLDEDDFIISTQLEVSTVNACIKKPVILEEDEIFSLATQVLNTSVKMDNANVNNKDIVSSNREETNCDSKESSKRQAHQSNRLDWDDIFEQSPEKCNEDDVFDIATQVLQIKENTTKENDDVFNKTPQKLQKKATKLKNDVFEISTQNLQIQLENNWRAKEKDLPSTSKFLGSQNDHDVFDITTQVLQIDNMNLPSVNKRQETTKSDERRNEDELQSEKDMSKEKVLYTTSKVQDIGTDDVFDIPTQVIQIDENKVKKVILQNERNIDDEINEMPKKLQIENKTIKDKALLKPQLTKSNKQNEEELQKKKNTIKELVSSSMSRLQDIPDVDENIMEVIQIEENVDNGTLQKKSEAMKDKIFPSTSEFQITTSTEQNEKKLQKQESTAKDMFLPSTSKQNIVENDDIFDLPTQVFQVNENIAKKINNNENDDIFDIPTQVFQVNENIAKKINNKENNDVFDMPTQILQSIQIDKPEGNTLKEEILTQNDQQIDKRIQIVNVSSVPPSQTSTNTDYSYQSNSDNMVKIEIFDEFAATTQQIIHDINNSPTKNTRDEDFDHSMKLFLSENESVEEKVQKKGEPETQLEVDFELHTQKLYIESETNRPNNPLANMFSDEETQQNEVIEDEDLDEEFCNLETQRIDEQIKDDESKGDKSKPKNNQNRRGKWRKNVTTNNEINKDAPAPRRYCTSKEAKHNNDNPSTSNRQDAPEMATRSCTSRKEAKQGITLLKNDISEITRRCRSSKLKRKQSVCEELTMLTHSNDHKPSALKRKDLTETVMSTNFISNEETKHNDDSSSSHRQNTSEIATTRRCRTPREETKQGLILLKHKDDKKQDAPETRRCRTPKPETKQAETEKLTRSTDKNDNKPSTLKRQNSNKKVMKKNCSSKEEVKHYNDNSSLNREDIPEIATRRCHNLREGAKQALTLLKCKEDEQQDTPETTMKRYRTPKSQAKQGVLEELTMSSENDNKPSTLKRQDLTRTKMNKNRVFKEQAKQNLTISKHNNDNKSSTLKKQDVCEIATKCHTPREEVKKELMILIKHTDKERIEETGNSSDNDFEPKTTKILTVQIEKMLSPKITRATPKKQSTRQHSNEHKIESFSSDENTSSEICASSTDSLSLEETLHDRIKFGRRTKHKLLESSVSSISDLQTGRPKRTKRLPKRLETSELEIFPKPIIAKLPTVTKRVRKTLEPSKIEPLTVSKRSRKTIDPVIDVLTTTVEQIAVPKSQEKKTASVKQKIVFTMLNDESLEKGIQTLGGEVVESVYECTVLVSSKISRSLKFLLAIIMGKPIVGVKWIEDSQKNKRFIDPWLYILKDEVMETKYNFKLQESLERAKKSKLLDGHTIFPLVSKNLDVIKEIVQLSGAKCLARPPKSAQPNIYVVSYESDKAKYSKYVRQSNYIVVDAEAVFCGILKQQMEWTKHLLA